MVGDIHFILTEVSERTWEGTLGEGSLGEWVQ